MTVISIADVRAQGGRDALGAPWLRSAVDATINGADAARGTAQVHDG